MGTCAWHWWSRALLNCCSRSKSLWTDQISLTKTVVPLAYWVICYIFIWINLNTVNPQISAHPPRIFLLSNCSEYRPNNSTNIQRYCTVICIVETLFALQVDARTQNCHTLPVSLINLLTNSNWIINLLLDVLVCSIALYFDSPYGLVKIRHNS